MRNHLLSFLLAAACPLAAPAIHAQQPVAADAVRVLVTRKAGEEDSGAAALLGDRAVALLGRQLRQLGHEVISEQRLAELQERYRAIAGQEAEGQPARGLLEFANADLMVRVSVRVVDQRMQQGRFVVEDELRAQLMAVDDARLAADRSHKGTGRSMRSFDAAHEQALTEACGGTDAPGSLVAHLAGAIEQRREAERQRGARYTVAIHTDLGDVADQPIGGSDLQGLAGVAKDSVDLRNAPPGRQVFTLRFRGKRYQLQEALAALVAAKRAQIAEDGGAGFGARILVAPSSFDVILEARPPTLDSLDEELRRTMRRIVEPLYEQSPDWYDGTSPRFQPASIPSAASQWNELQGFAQSYWREYERLAEQDPERDPLDAEGSVEVAGTPFKSLRAARERAEQLASAYSQSSAGQTARSIAAYADAAFREVSGGEVNGLVDDAVQASILYTIKSDMQLFRDEGAVNADSIQFFSREGADRLVITRLTRPLDTYRLEIIVADVESGVKRSGSAEIDPRYTDELAQEIKG